MLLAAMRAVTATRNLCSSPARAYLYPQVLVYPACAALTSGRPDRGNDLGQCHARYLTPVQKDVGKGEPARGRLGGGRLVVIITCRLALRTPPPDAERRPCIPTQSVGTSTLSSPHLVSCLLVSCFLSPVSCFLSPAFCLLSSVSCPPVTLSPCHPVSLTRARSCQDPTARPAARRAGAVHLPGWPFHPRRGHRAD